VRASCRRGMVAARLCKVYAPIRTDTTARRRRRCQKICCRHR
jgi:hypothetical protein